MSDGARLEKCKFRDQLGLDGEAYAEVADGYTTGS